MTVRMPAETAPHQRTLMCWPARRDLYGELFADAEAAHAEVARTIAAYEPVTMVAKPGAAERAASLCGQHVEVVELPLDDSWARDTGPIYVLDSMADGDVIVATDWRFNGWGGKFLPYDEDAQLARRWADLAGHRRVGIDAVLEGGSITVDGQGTLVTTTQCLLHPNRNPHLARVDIEALLAAHLGADTVIWLPHGLADDDDTDGHVDNVAAFVEPGRLLVQGCDDPDEPDWLRLHVNRRHAERAPDARGVPLEVVEVPVLPFAEIGGARRPVPYLNLYVGNGFVLVPVCGHEADNDMADLLAEQFPGRDIVCCDVGAILAFGGGGIHCITQQIPAP
jgi:agmatine deiminase